uniref:Uncharacterized protein n=1 Tax=Parastrongyloides trichosuri TaxID=131310 RepID=A0A0N4ZEL2_PARTI
MNKKESLYENLGTSGIGAPPKEPVANVGPPLPAPPPPAPPPPAPQPRNVQGSVIQRQRNDSIITAATNVTIQNGPNGNAQTCRDMSRSLSDAKGPIKETRTDFNNKDGSLRISTEILLKFLPYAIFSFCFISVTICALVTGSLYLPQLSDHALICGYDTLLNNNEELKGMKDDEKKKILLFYGQMAKIYSEGSQQSVHLEEVERLYKSYIDNAKSYNGTCIKHTKGYGHIKKVIKELNFKIDLWEPNEEVIVKWMSPGGSTIYKVNIVFLVISSGAVLVQVVFIALRIKSENMFKFNIFFKYFTLFNIALQILSLVLELSLFVSWNGKFTGLLIAFVVSSAFKILLGIAIFAYIIHKKL